MTPLRSQGKWLISLRNKYGYHKTFKQYVYKSQKDSHEHHEFFKENVFSGKHDFTFDPQKIELHLSRKKQTKDIRFGINHPIAWLYRNHEYRMISKDDIKHNPIFDDEYISVLYFLCLQELSRRSLSLSEHPTSKNKMHKRAIVHCLFILQRVINEAKKRDLY